MRDRLPGWATHLAVEEDGAVWVFEGEPHSVAVARGNAAGEVQRFRPPAGSRFCWVGNAPEWLDWAKGLVLTVTREG